MSDHALVVGVDAYESAWAGAALDNAVGDALAFAEWLVDQGGLAPKNILLALAPGQDSPATPAKLAAATELGAPTYNLLNDVVGALPDQLGEVERFFFYFAGHGVSFRNGILLLEAMCCADYRPSRTMASLTVASLAQELRFLKAREQFLIIDACRDHPGGPPAIAGQISPGREGSGRSPQFVLQATSAGDRAAATGRGAARKQGAFTRALLAGLNGNGAAKRWCSEKETYAVFWSSLASEVCASVERRAIDVGDGTIQVPQPGGQHGALDPVLAEYEAAAFAPQSLEAEIAPAPSPASAQIEWQRVEGGFESGFEPAPTGRVKLMLPPSSYNLRARAPGHVGRPKLIKVPLYGPVKAQTLTLEPDPAAGPAPPNTTPVMWPIGTGNSHLWRKPVHHHYGPDPPLPEMKAAQAPARAALTIYCADPLVALSIGTLGGQEVVAGALSISALALSPGNYRAAAVGADGRAVQEDVALDPGEREDIELAPPPDPAVAALVGRSGRVTEALFVSEWLDPVAGATLATLALISVAHALLRLPLPTEIPQLGRAWSEARPPGLHLIAIDERASGPAPQRKLRLWRMRHPNTPVVAVTAAVHPELPIVEAAATIRPGNYWLEFQDVDRTSRAGFKLATAVLPDALTVVLEHVRTDGSIELQQHLIRSAASPLAVLQSLRSAEVVQRALATDRFHAAGPALGRLAEGCADAPFAAALAAFGLLDPWMAPKRDGMADWLTADWFAEHAATAHSLVDAAVLAADLAERSGREARPLWAAAIARGAAPVSVRALEELIDAARRHRIFNRDQRWLAEKRKQTVPHPLWVVRREDDLRPGDTPRVIDRRSGLSRI